MDAGELNALAGILSGLTLSEWRTVSLIMEMSFRDRENEAVRRAIDGVGSCGMDAPQLSERLARHVIGDGEVVGAEHGKADRL